MGGFGTSQVAAHTRRHVGRWPARATRHSRTSLARWPPRRPCLAPRVRALPEAAPVAVSTPAVDLHIEDLVQLGFNDDGALDVPGVGMPPATTSTAGPGGWGPRSSPATSTPSPARPSSATSATFAPGDTVRVRRSDGRVAVFIVYAVECYPWTTFHPEGVWVQSYRVAAGHLRRHRQGGDRTLPRQHRCRCVPDRGWLGLAGFPAIGEH